MAVGVARSPMDPAVFRFWSRAGRVALIAGIPLIVLAGILTSIGLRHAVITTVLWWLVLPCAVAFVVNAIVGNTRWSPSADEVAALATSGGVAERRMVARWRGAPTEVLRRLADDGDPAVSRAASANPALRRATADEPGRMPD